MAELAVRLIGSLALVVGLMLLIARGVNKRFKAPAGAAIQVVHRQSIGRGTGIAVVSVGTRVLVIGTTEQQVTLLTEVEPDEVGLDPELLELQMEERAEAEVERATRPDQPARTGRPAVSDAGALAGSLLSVDTWKQTLAAFTNQKKAS